VRPRATILVKLLGALVVPTVALFALFAVVAYEVSARDLDAELGTRLSAIAASAATQVRGKYLAELKAGDDGERAYQNAVKKLEAVAQATGAELFLFDRAFDNRGDTIGTPLGAHLYQVELDRAELARVFATGVRVASVTFDGSDGKTYKAGYAPVHASETEPEIVLAIGARAPAAYFDRLADLRLRLLRWGAGLAAVSIFAAVLATLLLTRGLRRLAAAAERIGGGDLRAPVVATSRDELGRLAETMERMRQQLAARDARMQQMLAGIAHEVRNPLAGMTLFAGILRDELPTDDERHGHVLRIERELAYLERVVTEFLDYARRAPPELADVDLVELLTEVAGVSATAAVEVVVDPLADDARTARGDRGQLRRALINLAQNAVQATDAPAEGAAPAVHLAATATATTLTVTVTNRGSDIPADVRARLFEPFFTTREKGTGLGLAFVREIATAHDGDIAITHDAGLTRFAITLPRPS
jgi:signal transduction histidine kinase